VSLIGENSLASHTRLFLAVSFEKRKEIKKEKLADLNASN
jgi:hypothetical protein